MNNRHNSINTDKRRGGKAGDGYLAFALTKNRRGKSITICLCFYQNIATAHGICHARRITDNHLKLIINNAGRFDMISIARGL